MPKVLSPRALRPGLAGVSILAGVVLFAAPAPAGATPFTVATEQLVVQLGQSRETDPASVLVGIPGPVPELLPGQRWSTDLPTVEAAEVETELSKTPGVNYVSPVQEVEAAGLVVPDNPCYNETCGPTKPVTVENPFAGAGATIVHPNGQSDLWAVHASQAWGITTGSAGVLVAVLDTGVDPNQPQLKGRVIVGPDVCLDDRPLCASPYDNNGHGTFVTGIIAAADNDGIGIASLGWDTKVIDIKVLDDSGAGNSMDEATGIYDAVAAGARVINLSLQNQPCNENPSDCGPTRTKKKRLSTLSRTGSWWWQRPGTTPRALRTNRSTRRRTRACCRSRPAPTREPLIRSTVVPTWISLSTEMLPISRHPGSTSCLRGTTAIMRWTVVPRWLLRMCRLRRRS